MAEGVGVDDDDAGCSLTGTVDSVVDMIVLVERVTGAVPISIISQNATRQAISKSFAANYVHQTGSRLFGQ